MRREEKEQWDRARVEGRWRAEEGRRGELIQCKTGKKGVRKCDRTQRCLTASHIVIVSVCSALSTRTECRHLMLMDEINS